MILVAAPANDNLAPVDVKQNVYLLTGKPQISQTTQQISAREDQSVVLRCEASGFPPAVVTWEPSSLLSDPRFQIHGQDLVISNVRLSDNGQIKCKATNALGTSEKTFGIRVLREWCVVSGVDVVWVMSGRCTRCCHNMEKIFDIRVLCEWCAEVSGVDMM